MNFSGNPNENFLFRFIEQKISEGFIEDIDFSECSISGYDFSFMNLKNINFDQGAIIDCNFDNCILENINFDFTTIEECSFENVTLINTNLPAYLTDHTTLI